MPYYLTALIFPFIKFPFASNEVNTEVKVPSNILYSAIPKNIQSTETIISSSVLAEISPKPTVVTIVRDQYSPAIY